MPCGRASTPAPRSRRRPAPMPAGQAQARRRRHRADRLRGRRFVHRELPSGSVGCLLPVPSIPRPVLPTMATEASRSAFRRTVAFTGRLAARRRGEAFALVRRRGGAPRRGVTRTTGVLVVGGLGWPLLPDGKPSKSLSLARKYGVAIASEREFLEWAGRAVPDEQARTYSASQIASLSGLPPEVVEQLTALGLLDGLDG